ncbi:MAG: hypothetical protein ACR2HY_07710 [Acidimicrobiales bacterium]
MSWLWFDLCPGTVSDALASAVAYDEHDREIATLAAWPKVALRPSPSAATIDERAIDPNGAAGWVSWARGSGGMFLPFDDPAVAQATRMVLSMPPAAAFSTLVEGDDRCVGALTATLGGRGELAYDPFANLFPTVVMRVEAGILGRMPAPVGPVTQRYGADNPWPWDRF